MPEQLIPHNPITLEAYNIVKTTNNVIMIMSSLAKIEEKVPYLLSIKDDLSMIKKIGITFIAILGTIFLYLVERIYHQF